MVLQFILRYSLVFFIIIINLCLLAGETSQGLALHIVLPTIPVGAVIMIIAVCLYYRYVRKHKQGMKLPNTEEISIV